MSNVRRINLNEVLPDHELSELRSVLSELRSNVSTDPQIINLTENLIAEFGKGEEGERN